jgi:hypothetical protein
MTNRFLDGGVSSNDYATETTQVDIDLTLKAIEENTGNATDLSNLEASNTSIDNKMTTNNSLLTTIDSSNTNISNKTDSNNTLLINIDSSNTNISNKTDSNNTLLTTIDVDTSNISSKIDSVDTSNTSIDTKLTSTNSLLTDIEVDTTNIDTSILEITNTIDDNGLNYMKKTNRNYIYHLHFLGTDLSKLMSVPLEKEDIGWNLKTGSLLNAVQQNIKPYTKYLVWQLNCIQTDINAQCSLVLVTVNSSVLHDPQINIIITFDTGFSINVSQISASGGIQDNIKTTGGFNRDDLDGTGPSGIDMSILNKKRNIRVIIDESYSVFYFQIYVEGNYRYETFHEFGRDDLINKNMTIIGTTVGLIFSSNSATEGFFVDTVDVYQTEKMTIDLEQNPLIESLESEVRLIAITTTSNNTLLENINNVTNFNSHPTNEILVPIDGKQLLFNYGFKQLINNNVYNTVVDSYTNADDWDLNLITTNAGVPCSIICTDATLINGPANNLVEIKFYSSKTAASVTVVQTSFNGQNEVTFTNNFYRLVSWRWVDNSSVNAVGIGDGFIYDSGGATVSGVPSNNIYAIMNNEARVSSQALIYVPHGKILYLKDVNIFTNTKIEETSVSKRYTLRIYRYHPDGFYTYSRVPLVKGTYLNNIIPVNTYDTIHYKIAANSVTASANPSVGITTSFWLRDL